MSLEECLHTALERNRARPASAFALAAAEAQHRQALSAYWPQISLRGALEIMDQPQNYIFPSSTFSVPSMTMDVPASSFQVPPMAVTIPANAFGPGFPPVDVQLPVPGQTISVPGQQLALPSQDLTIPDQEIKLMERESAYASLGGQWLLWDGGMRRGMREQAQAGADAARAALRRTELEIVHDVTRLYFGAVLARQVREVGEDALARMEATLRLTETLYQEGAGRVQRTDYLNNKVMVETLRSGVAQLEQNQTMAEAALAFTMGMEWNQSVRPSAAEIPFEPIPDELESLVAEAYEFSPDWARLEAGLRAGDGALTEARSGHLPRIGLAGDLHRWWNDYDKGMATKENKQGWTVRLGLELPLFQGFLARNRVEEARARLGKLQEERILLRDGLGLQVREIFVKLGAAGRGYQATLDAMSAAIEGRELNTRAYQNDLAETEDLIKSQLLEAFMSAQHYKMRYDHADLRARLDLVVGRELHRRLGGQ